MICFLLTEPLEPLPQTPSPGGVPIIPVQEGLFPGDLDLLEQAVVANPATVSIGQTVTVIIPFRDPTSPSLLADVFVLGPPQERNTAASFQELSFTPDRGITPSLDGAPAGRFRSPNGLATVEKGGTN